MKYFKNLQGLICIQKISYIIAERFHIVARLNYKMNFKKSFLLFQEIVVSKKSLFWAAYLALNGLLQREIAQLCVELVLQTRLPRTLGQINLWFQQLFLSQEQLFLSQNLMFPRQDMLYSTVKTADATPGTAVSRAGSTISRAVSSAPVFWADRFYKVFAIKEQLSRAI
jgi:hypothetical protein